VLFEWLSEAVLGLPAYTTPAWPFGLNGDPEAVAEAPGVTGLDGPQVLVGAPGWPVVGLTVAAAVVAVATISATRQNTMITSFLRSTPSISTPTVRQRLRRYVEAIPIGLTKPSCDSRGPVWWRLSITMRPAMDQARSTSAPINHHRHRVSVPVSASLSVVGCSGFPVGHISVSLR